MSQESTKRLQTSLHEHRFIFQCDDLQFSKPKPCLLFSMIRNKFKCLQTIISQVSCSSVDLLFSVMPNLPSPWPRDLILLFWTTLRCLDWWLVLDGWRTWGSGTRQKWKKVGKTKCLFIYRLSDLTKEQLLRNRLAFCMDSSTRSYMVIIIRAWMSIILAFYSELWTLREI